MTNQAMEDSSAKLPRTCFVRLQSVYPTLKKAEKKAADVIFDSPELIADHTIIDVATMSGCSQTTWFRLAKRLGYSGFHEFREDLALHIKELPLKSELSDESLRLYDNIDKTTTPINIAKQIFDSSINSLHDTYALIDEAVYTQALDALIHADKILLCGSGDAYSVVRSAYQKLLRAGINVFAHEDLDLQYITLDQMKRGDVLVAFSYSGRTKTIVDLAKLAQKDEITVVSITNFPFSPLAKNSDYILQTAAFSEQINGEIMSKRITQLCLFESLYINLMMKSQKNLEEKIASSHKAIESNKI